MERWNRKILFFSALLLVGLAGSLTNGLHLLRDFYVRPLARFTGYASLLAYALLMLRPARYNTPHSKKETPDEN